ncbi:IS110 family transposase [Psychrosphaera algicola]|uniref:Transposase n=1 Tax=Psychrosphaera algicola TaxID=3023714 RepID=A0ABT5FFZ8_9GAMM|nr:transposase [Psychrosphaera sp. G1-22]MDC2890474.1 transposase [Psychrosphaera sp. G1-22]
MTLYCGIDLHSNNHVIVVIDEEDNKLVNKRIDNNLSTTIELLSPFKNQLHSIAVESTFNWYWLVDGLLDAGFSVELVNTAAVKQYEGLKYSGDHQDAFFLAHLMRLGILPTGHIYPKERRAVRDLLRRRRQLVRQSSTHLISIQNQIWRSLGYRVDSNQMKKLDFELPFEQNSYLYHSANANLQVLQLLQLQIHQIETEVLNAVNLENEYKLLTGITGIGPILGLTIMLETGNIQRFDDVGNYVSYCRCVNSLRESNGKKKAQATAKQVTNTYHGRFQKPRITLYVLTVKQSVFMREKSKTKRHRRHTRCGT